MKWCGSLEHACGKPHVRACDYHDTLWELTSRRREDIETDYLRALGLLLDAIQALRGGMVDAVAARDDPTGVSR